MLCFPVFFTPEENSILRGIAAETVTAANIKYHAEIVREKAGLRQFQKMCMDVLGGIESGDIEDYGSAGKHEAFSRTEDHHAEQDR